MANLFIEGWEPFPVGALNTNSGSPWQVGSSVGSNFIAVRNNAPISFGNYLNITDVSASSTAYRFFGSQTEVYFGFAVVFGAFDSTGAGSGLGVMGVSGSDSLTLTVWVNAVGQLVVWRGTTLQATDTERTLTTGTKYYIEGKVTPTTYEILLDGVLVLSGSITSIGDLGYAFVRKGINCSSGRVDDCYWNNADGDVNNGYLGEISVVPLFPDTDESPQDWDLSSGSDAYSLIGVTPPDDGYISAQNVDDEAAFTFEEIPFPVTDIFAVQTTYRAQKESSGESAVQLSLTHGGSTETGEENFTAETTYAWYFDNWETDPDTEEAWDPDAFDPKVTLKRTV